ncbi:hypothetical protein Cgig2_008767 [Carnegiea gigantea]|uniref:Uncharacterized protein n=1 Tax=Carnegiea gigantea TaxID=171969 RepID=A0A9Q1QD71_9CARY|nr:hypothetical protein Cgig2_008767 [Carnegiea gigantea]
MEHHLRPFNDLDKYFPHMLHLLELQNKLCNNNQFGLLDLLQHQNQLRNMFSLLLQVEHYNWFCNHLSSHMFSMHQLKHHDDLGNYLPHLSKFIYPADKAFDKHVLKHVAKHFKQYKHSLKKDYFKPEEKTKENMYDIVPKGHSRDGWMRLVDYWCSTQYETLAKIGRDAQASQTHCHTTGSTSYAEKRADFVETYGREPTHLEFSKGAHSKEGGEFIANTATEEFLVEIKNEVFDELMYEEENPKRPISFGFNVDRSDVFGVNSVLRKRGYVFPDNNMELKRVKEELASQKAMFLLMLRAVRNGKITNEFLDATEVALHMARDQVLEESSGNDLSNGLRHTGPSTSTS